LSQQNLEVKVGTPKPEKDISSRCGKLKPGEMVSIDQYVSTLLAAYLRQKEKSQRKISIMAVHCLCAGQHWWDCSNNLPYLKS